jgi:hypothetical protein
MLQTLQRRNRFTALQEGEQTDHLEPLSARNEVERLIVQVLTEQRGFNQSDPEDVRLMKALADAFCEYWKVYRQRNETSTLSKHTHTRSRMRQHFYPLSTSR